MVNVNVFNLISNKMNTTLNKKINFFTNLFTENQEGKKYPE